MSPALPRLFFLALTIAVTLASAFAQTDNWKGGTGNWSNSMQWDAGVPGPNSDVVIATGLDQATLDVDATVNSLSLGLDAGSSYLITVAPQNFAVTQDMNVGNAGYFVFSNRSVISIGGNVTSTGTIEFGFIFSPGQVRANIDGILTNEQPGLVEIERNSSVTTSGVVNSGLFLVQDNSTLKVNGDLWNQANPPGHGNGALHLECATCLSAAGNKVIVTGSIINDGLIFLHNYADSASAPRLENSSQVLMTGGTLQVGTPQAVGPGYYQSSNGVLAEHINMGANAYGFISVDGPIHLGGTLQILLQDGYNPPPGLQFPLY